MNDTPTGEPPKQSGDKDLSDLRSRLDALHGSVERLGREEPGTPEPAAQQPASPSPYDHTAAEQPPAPYYEAPPGPSPSPYEPGVGYPVTDPAYAPYQPPAPDPAPVYYPDTAADPYAPAPADPYAPAPAATNGQGEPELGAGVLAANIAILDVGPFADLIELRHFEEAVARLEAVRDVRVRRFGHRRAMIELGLEGPYAISRELYRLGRPMEVEPGPDGEVIVDFTDVPDVTEEQPAEATTEAEVTGEPVTEQGEGPPADSDSENV